MKPLRPFTPQEMAGNRHVARLNQAMALPDQVMPEPRRRQLCAHAAEARLATQRKLDGFSKRARVREAVFARLKVLDLYVGYDRQLNALLDRMMFARKSFSLSVRLSDGKCLRQWNQKSGDARLDPDDAREEAARFSRRVSPAVDKLIESGARVTYAVFTMPNFAPGDLRRGCKTIYRRFGTFMRRCKRGKVPGGCSGIRGAAVVLEAPLGAGRDWNVHLNVLLVHNGFIDYRALRAAWHWNVELRPVVPTQSGVAAALREIIKYNVLSVAEKSASKAKAGSRAPALVDWTDPELWEWITAFRRFRRTRTYGVLYRLPKPDKIDQSDFVVVGFGTWSSKRGSFLLRFPLLDSIPEDKSNRGEGRPTIQVRDGYARAGPTTGATGQVLT